jgi:glycosyltransferase involved in cell wall biosynthesis
MRITFLINRADLSGATRVVAIYADRLRKRGHDVVVVSRAPGQPNFKQRLRGWMTGAPAGVPTGPSHFDGTEIDHRTVDVRRPLEPRDLPPSDVLVATSWESAEQVGHLPAASGAKVYFVQNHDVHPGLPMDRVEAVWRSPMHKVVIAQWMVDLAKHRFNNRDVSLVPNSVDTKQFYAGPRTKQAVPTVGFVYSTASFKGCDITIRAYEAARKKVRNLTLIAFGVTPPRPPVLLPSGTAYTVQPTPAAMRDLYASCDAWLFGSRSEGFGLPILEAMACRTPVIATPAGAAPELLAGQGGVLVHPEHPQSMGDAIVALANMTPTQWQAMSDRALATATRYTWNDAAARFEATLERVLGTRGK